MANLGPRDTSFLAMATGWDGSELAKYQLADGTTFDQVAAMINTALGALNAEFVSDWMTNLYSVTDQLTVEYRVGSSNGFDVHTEYGLPDAKRGATEGHMLPLLAYDRMLGWTFDFLREARMSQIEADIADALQDARDKRRVGVLTRLLDRDDDSGAAKGLGSSGYSPGFATTAGSTSVDFTPPTYNGTAFDSTHEHYVAIAGGVFTNDVFTDAAAELREHGHEAPYDFLIGPSDRSTVVIGLSKFTAAADGLVQLGMTQDRALVGTEYLGVIEGFRVREVPGIPQYYGFGYKSYGRLSQRNPLRLRVRKNQNGLVVVARAHPNTANNYPLQNLMLEMAFGVGVADRTNGTARYVNNSTWADGTPT